MLRDLTLEEEELVSGGEDGGGCDAGGGDGGGCDAGGGASEAGGGGSGSDWPAG